MYVIIISIIVYHSDCYCCVLTGGFRRRWCCVKRRLKLAATTRGLCAATTTGRGVEKKKKKPCTMFTCARSLARPVRRSGLASWRASLVSSTHRKSACLGLVGRVKYGKNHSRVRRRTTISGSSAYDDDAASGADPRPPFYRRVFVGSPSPSPVAPRYRLKCLKIINFCDVHTIAVGRRETTTATVLSSTALLTRGRTREGYRSYTDRWSSWGVVFSPVAGLFVVTVNRVNAAPEEPNHVTRSARDAFVQPAGCRWRDRYVRNSS